MQCEDRRCAAVIVPRQAQKDYQTSQDGGASSSVVARAVLSTATATATATEPIFDQRPNECWPKPSKEQDNICVIR